MTKKYAVLGSPIAHSKSPQIHNYLFEATGFDASYERFEVSDLADFLIRHPDFDGLSLTMPLKEQAFATASTLDANAIATGGVNTLLRVSDGWCGFNTDVQGIANAVGFVPTTVGIIGSGATAKSALQAFPKSTKLIFARNQALAKELAEKFDAEVVSFEKVISAEVVVSTVTEGVLPDLLTGAQVGGTLLDCVYTNPELPAGKYLSGLTMLVHQAVIQQRIFQFGDPNHSLKNESELVDGVLGLLGMAK